MFFAYSSWYFLLDFWYIFLLYKHTSKVLYLAVSMHKYFIVQTLFNRAYGKIGEYAPLA